MPTPPLAFGWISLPMLGWLAAAAAPLLLHLWNRRRYREVRWAAVRFLRAAAERQSRRLRIERSSLLALRVAIIAIVVAAVAEPYFDSPSLARATDGRVHHLLVLDGSFSMEARAADKTRFDRAKELARRIVQEAPQGDTFSLVVMASPPRRVVGSPTSAPAEVLREIDALRPSHTPADLPAAIRLVREVVDAAERENPRFARHEIVVLTDLQRITWAANESEFARAESLRQVAALADAARIHMIDLSQPPIDNLAVTALRVIDPPAFVGADAALEAEVANFGRQPRQRQPVELWIDGRRIDRKELDLAPGVAASVRFSYRFDAPADHAVEVRAPGDTLEIDNHRYLALPVREAIRALLIDGRPSGKPFGGAADYLAVALAPDASARIHAEIAPETAILERSLADYDCVFLCNVARFAPAEARVFDAYLRSGGSVVFFLGDQVVPESYNRELGGSTIVAGGQESGVRGQGSGADGEKRRATTVAGEPSGARHRSAANAPILPARLGPPVDSPESRLDPLGFRHPILRPLRGRGEISLLTTPVFKHYKLLISEVSQAKTVLALAGGDPLLVEGPVDHGRVLLFATSADPSWTGLPLWPSFVPLMREATLWCVRHEVSTRNVLVGMPLETVAPAPAGDTVATIQWPDGSLRRVSLRRPRDSADLIDTDAREPGIYTVRPSGLSHSGREGEGESGPKSDAAGPPRRFAVNVDTSESDLSSIDLAQLRERVWPGIAFDHASPCDTFHPSTQPFTARGAVRLPIFLLEAALALLLFETLAAWSIGRPEKRWTARDVV